jgi:hypothetical protein
MLILLYACPHTTIYVRILLKVLVTMRNSCNRDLLERSTHVYDWDPVFLDDALDRIIGASVLHLKEQLLHTSLNRL